MSTGLENAFPGPDIRRKTACLFEIMIVTELRLFAALVPGERNHPGLVGNRTLSGPIHVLES